MQKRKIPNTEGAPRKRRRLKYIAVLPSIITLMNAMFGFLAIVCASRGPGPRWEILVVRRFFLTYFALSGYMIFFAMITDLLDGQAARLSKTVSSFGGQLDSLSDAISFGVAPAFLMMKVVEVHYEHLRLESPRLTQIAGRSVLFIAIFYAMCAVIRLARFNVENGEDESAHMRFAGLPTPAAAGVVVSLVIFLQDFLPKAADRSDTLFRVFESIVVWALPFVTFLAGILMVTRISYPHAANQFLRGKKTFTTFLVVFFAGLLLVWNIQLAMVVGFCGFALFGVIRWAVLGIFRRERVRPAGDGGR
ncbi:MAG: CDP-alcohol phosphatidyltransferase family protein [Treponema sp.]|jgi:CDP-diacylglycerol--serine O-phosphatidyltransferase|nr:CDP-alcohol phosphatidyltransferase family protein [Treponema sp.]